MVILYEYFLAKLFQPLPSLGSQCHNQPHLASFPDWEVIVNVHMTVVSSPTSGLSYLMTVEFSVSIESYSACGNGCTDRIHTLKKHWNKSCVDWQTSRPPALIQCDCCWCTPTSSRWCSQSSVRVESQRLGERQSNKVSASFLENTSFIECALQEISGAWVDTKSRIIEATCISSGDRGQPCVTSCSQCEQQKPWWRPVNKAIVVLCVRTCKHN